jgi:dTDP-4-dehydrorhamnose 3,5-epimerase
LGYSQGLDEYFAYRQHPVILHNTRVQGAFLIESSSSADDRGTFTEVYQLRSLAERGWHGGFVRSAISHNHKSGTLRGLHYQRAPHSEAKLVTCIRGAVYDVIADIRPDSPTFGQWDGYELTPENRRALFLPEGVAHGYQTLCDETTVHYHLSDYYSPQLGAGIRWDDPTLAIRWPLPPSRLSDQDQRWGFLAR